jgi:CRISPR-associated exonuclease Cas4
MPEDPDSSDLKATEERQFTESELLPISWLADIEFCERRAALHLLEMAWEDHIHTVGGSIMHEHVHADQLSEKRGDTIIVRGLWIRSLRHGLAGKADVVELHRVDDNDVTGATISGHRGFWRVFPIEYKPGRLQHQMSFQIQLCAQAICLEEMLCCNVPAGAIFYGKPHRRLDIVFDRELRRQTAEAASRLHKLTAAGVTPRAEYTKRCKSCSLVELCLPKVSSAKRSVERYLRTAGEEP